jgi:lysophospholipase L1-like esterase
MHWRDNLQGARHPAVGAESSTRLVTLTVGGNDLKVSGLATTCLTQPLNVCLTKIGEAQTSLDALRDALADLYAEAADAAPRALIVVTGYPHLLEERTPLFDQTLIDAVNGATDELNGTIQEAVHDADPTGKKIVYVGVTDEFAGHGIGSTNSFINFFPDDLTSQENFHPNADGYRLYAHAILAELRGKLLDEPAQLA